MAFPGLIELALCGNRADFKAMLLPHADAELPKRLSTELRELAESSEHAEASLGELFARLEGRAYTLLVVLLSLPFCQPVALPGLSTPFGVIIALLGLRFAFFQEPWLPRRLLNTRLPSRFLPKILRAGARMLGVMEKLLHPRMVAIFEYRVTQFLSGIAICICGLLLLLPLPIPFSNMMPALTVIWVAASTSERDGLMLIAASVIFSLTIGFFGAIFWGGTEMIGWVHFHLGQVFGGE